MTVSISQIVNEGVLTQSLYPLYILLARPVSDVTAAEFSTVYHFRRACILTGFTDIEGSNLAQANFIVHEITELAMEAKSGLLAILLVSFANGGGCCLWGRISLESLYLSLEKSPNLSSRQRAEMLLPVDMHYCLLKIWHQGLLKMAMNVQATMIETYIKVRADIVKKALSYPMKLIAKNAGVNGSVVIEKVLSSDNPNCGYNAATGKYEDLMAAGIIDPTKFRLMVCLSSSFIICLPTFPLLYLAMTNASLSKAPAILSQWLRERNVIFNYRYYNNKLQRTEAASTPPPKDNFFFKLFGPCLLVRLVKCASFKGLRQHLPACHDLFNFEFWLTEEYQAVNVSVKTDIWRSEIVADGVDPKQQTFFFYTKQLRRRRPKSLVQNARHVHPVFLESNLPARGCELLDKSHEIYYYTISLSLFIFPSDGKTFISTDDLRINLWNLEISNQSFNIVDVKLANMEDLTEFITSA
ncbi:hypothetical protein REPUB_Repub03eG0147400 [Reevesia pubescens]